MDIPAASRPPRFCLIRSSVLADFLTLGNDAGGAGTGSALRQYPATAESRWLVLAVVLLPVANLWMGERALGGLTLHPLAFIYALSGSAMISPWHVPKF